MTGLLLFSAGVLGLLAFFEPCTIATHTLFALRAHKSDHSGRLRAFRSLFLTRTVLVVALLILAVTVTKVPRWNPLVPGISLLVLAAVYIISRFTYVPLPHLEFYKLLPQKLTRSPGVQLGLTLPACTIPLFAVITGLSIMAASIPLVTLGGFVFAGMFTLPTAIAIIKGVSSSGLILLDRSAKIAPFLTAFLFIGGALLILIPPVDMGIQNLKLILQTPTLTGIVIGFIAGLVFSFNPVAFTSLSVVLAYVTKASEKRRAVVLGLAFISGLILTHVVLGVAASAGGEWVKNVMGRFWGVILGPVLIFLGFLWPGWIRIRFPWFGMRGRVVSGPGGDFFLGIPFSIAVCPLCSPALLVMLTASATIGSIPFGFFLLLSFALGRSIPILLGAWSMGWLESLHVFIKYQKKIEILAGIIMIISGAYLLNEYLLIIS